MYEGNKRYVQLIARIKSCELLGNHEDGNQQPSISEMI